MHHGTEDGTPDYRRKSDSKQASKRTIKKRSMSRSLKAHHSNFKYICLFNRTVEDHFSHGHVDCDDYQYKRRDMQRTEPRLQASKIAISKAYYIPAEVYRSGGVSDEDLDILESGYSASNHDFRALPGTLWSSHEKHIFFTCLARYSIHRVEEIADHLPEKSILEITAYYELLKRQLRDLKRAHRVRAHIQARDDNKNDKNDIKNGVKTDLILVYPLKGVSYSALPIAKEVDEQWEQFEEHQSILLSEQAQILSSRKASQRLIQFHQYTDQTSDMCLINNDIASSICRIYRANREVPILEGKKSAKLSFESMVFLEEYIRLKTKELIAEVILQKAPAEKTDEREAGTVDYSVTVRRSDIWKAAERLQMYQTPVAGFHSRYRDGKTPLLDHYWQNILTSLRPVTTTEITLFPPKKENRYFESQVKEYHALDSFEYEEEESDDSDDTGTETLVYSELGSRPLKRKAHEMDLEDDLFQAETTRLEAMDLRESIRYLKALYKKMGLRYLNTPSSGTEKEKSVLSEVSENTETSDISKKTETSEISEKADLLSETSETLSNTRRKVPNNMASAWDKCYAQY